MVDSPRQILERVHRMHKNSLTVARRAIIISAMILAATLVIAGCKKKSANSSGIEPRQTLDHDDNNEPSTDPVTSNTDEHDVSPKISLNDVIRAAAFWRPSYTDWYGKTAPNFTLTGLDGKEHKLTDYRGKDVMLVFWATWCGPCIYESPHIVALRNSVSKDKLAILAISYEKRDKVKRFVAEHRINYTVLLEKNNLPAPFGVMRILRTSGIPCSFFIDPDGRIKLATSGVLRLADMKAILQAE
jgi:peroxiredoxin